MWNRFAWFSISGRMCRYSIESAGKITTGQPGYSENFHDCE
jgi:hypothetical protein